ncbi:MAG: DUF4357 domain-containing protein [Actinomycetota bacterium]|nr:DUF4357 domain-containing protein [Actinomycetota bacterium]
MVLGGSANGRIEWKDGQGSQDRAAGRRAVCGMGGRFWPFQRDDRTSTVGRWTRPAVWPIAYSRRRHGSGYRR